MMGTGLNYLSITLLKVYFNKQLVTWKFILLHVQHVIDVYKGGGGLEPPPSEISRYFKLCLFIFAYQNTYTIFYIKINQTLFSINNNFILFL